MGAGIPVISYWTVAFISFVSGDTWTVTLTLLILGSWLFKDALISSETRISLKLVFKSNKDSFITEPKLGSNGFSPKIVKTIFLTDLLIASSSRIAVSYTNLRAH